MSKPTAYLGAEMRLFSLWNDRGMVQVINSQGKTQWFDKSRVDPELLTFLGVEVKHGVPLKEPQHD